ncbi:MAG TPA: acyl-CoA carboxylase subunit epsilon [Trebonia sp.]|nr:acyl-CoA carboxylase subunit epsilon [Trebonia sp.]
MAEIPYLQVVKGDATPEEIAALVATLTAIAAARAAAPPAPARSAASAWTDKSRQLRPALHPSPAGWRRSALPSLGHPSGFVPPSWARGPRS